MRQFRARSTGSGSCLGHRRRHRSTTWCERTRSPSSRAGHAEHPGPGRPGNERLEHDPRVTDNSDGAFRAVLRALGEELWVEEEKYVDMATALSGTGPTYVFLMMEALIDAGVHMGFPRRIAEQIVLQTVSGSVAFARDSGKHMAELRNMVTSPGGTSAEAIYQMEKGGLRTVLSRAVYAAYQRTQVLAGRERQNIE